MVDARGGVSDARLRNGARARRHVAKATWLSERRFQKIEPLGAWRKRAIHSGFANFAREGNNHENA